MTITTSHTNLCNVFFESTDENHMVQFANGSSLEKLVKQLEDIEPIGYLSQSNSEQIPDRLKRLSEIKKRLANAIEMKRNYYDNHRFGIVTKYFLMLFGKWNNGDTAAIVSAENFLLLWDSRKPVRFFSSYGKYIADSSHFKSSNTKDFYNYNPRREIELNDGTKINYTNLKG